MGITYASQKEFFIKELDQDEVFEDTWKSEKVVWLDYVRNDVF